MFNQKNLFQIKNSPLLFYFSIFVYFHTQLPKIYAFINQPKKIVLPKNRIKMSSRRNIEAMAERLFSFQITLI